MALLRNKSLVDIVFFLLQTYKNVGWNPVLLSRDASSVGLVLDRPPFQITYAYNIRTDEG
jgi:hypothetical protein